MTAGQAAIQRAFDARGFVLGAEVYAAVGPDEYDRVRGRFLVVTERLADGRTVELPLPTAFVLCHALGVTVDVWVHIMNDKRPGPHTVAAAFSEHLRTLGNPTPVQEG